jgi:hypothetical protein
MVQRFSHETSTSVTSARPENIERLVSALSPYHPRLRGAPDGLPFLFDVETLSNGMNFTLATDLGDIDSWSSVRSGRVPGCRARRHLHTVVWLRVPSGFSRFPYPFEKGRRQEQRPECPTELEALKEMHAQKEQTEPPQD